MKKINSKILKVIHGKNCKIINPVNMYECTLGDNVFVGPFVEIQKNVKIGNNTRISSHSFICELVEIGKNCFVGHGVNFTNDLFKMYVSCYILKEKELKYFPKRYRTNMFNLHQSYLESLQKSKDKVTFSKVVTYVNSMEPALLMYCMNMDYRKNEHTKEVLETLSFNKQPESTVPQ